MMVHFQWSFLGKTQKVILAGLTVILLALTFSGPAQAIPSFARQTGMPCTACHTQAFGPNLNPFGRKFKLAGYTMGYNNSILSRFSGMAMGSFTNTLKKDADLPENMKPHHFSTNNNLAFDQASLFFGGRVAGPVGAFVQLTYDGIGNHLALDNTDIRVAHDVNWLGQNFVYGVTFNNNPTAQDLWNTTPAWGYPYVSSSLARTPGASPVISSFGGQVGGLSFYNMLNDILYIEAGGYFSFPKNAQRGMGNFDDRKIDGGAPYWRAAVQKEWQGHYLSLGHFGFNASVLQAGAVQADRYTDLGVDFNYQYLANPAHIYEFKTSYIHEDQKLAMTDASPNQRLGFFGLNGIYTFDQTWSASFAFNHIYGKKDVVLYSNSPMARPNSEYYTFGLDYIPFGKQAAAGDTYLNSYLNVRFSLQYIYYARIDGGNKNYDGSGRNAIDNNTLYFNTWLVF